MAESSDRWPISWFVTGVCILTVEACLKYWSWSTRYEAVILDIPDIVSFNVVYVLNRYSAFGMMRAVPDYVNKGLLIVAVGFLIVLTVQQARAKDSTVIMRRGIFCFIIGALGNLVDRMLLGGVVDYIDFRLGPNGSTYALAWNISDMVINAGFAHVILEAMRPEKPKEKAV
jgi:signal peptidase II